MPKPSDLEEPICYVYRHIRLDTNMPFYIGVGSDTTYNRAFVKLQRNKFWNSVVSKTSYEVEIMMDNLTWEQACEKEKEFIKLYGRRNLGTGTLVNMTDGGQGTIGRVVSEKVRKQTSDRMLGNKFYLNYIITDEIREKIREAGRRRVTTPEMRASLSRGQKGKKRAPEAIAKIAAKVRMFSMEQAREIRALREGGLSVTKIAKMYKCSEPTIRDIVNKKRYKDVK